jgi:hypothetical protein
MIFAVQVILVRAQIFQRDVNLGRARQFYVRPEHTDDFALHPVESDVLADDTVRTAETAFP